MVGEKGIHKEWQRNTGILNLQGAPNLSDFSRSAMLAKISRKQDGLHADTTAAFLVVDMSLGAWRAREAAYQLGLQLNLALDPVDGSGFDTGTLISRGVDVEARGDALIGAACRDASCVVDALGDAPCSIRVLPPKFGAMWRPENEWLLHYLGGSGIVLECDGNAQPFQHAPEPVWLMPPAEGGIWPSDLPDLTPDQRRLLAFFPGLLPEAIAGLIQFPEKILTSLVKVASAFRCIPPLWRDCAPASSATEIDALACHASRDEGLLAFTQMFGSNLFIDSARLVGIAHRSFLAGSSHLALELLGRARSGARLPQVAALCDLHTQGIRIFEHRFQEVAAMPPPSPKLPQAVQLSLRQMKGWGEIMSGRVDAAVGNLRTCLDGLAQGRVLADDELYLLNIYALSLYRAGDIPASLELEDRIEASLKAGPTPDFRLVFVNAINQARLHRALGNWEKYAVCVERAFATSAGARSWSEIVQLNLMRAEPLSQAASPDARLCLLRAALSWLAIPAPESASIRVARAVLRGTLPERRDWPDKIAIALHERLVAAWPMDEPGERDAAIVSSENACGGQLAVVGGPGAAVLWSPSPRSNKPRRLRSPETRRLTAAALLRLCALAPGWNCPPTGEWLVDDCLGQDIPSSRAAALDVALRRGAGRIVWSANDETIDASDRNRWEAESAVSLGPGVARLSGGSGATIVHFHRFLSPAAIDPADEPWLRVVASAPSNGQPRVGALSAATGISPDDLLRRARLLELRRVVKFST